MMTFFIAISGLLLLIGGAELLVRGASRLARMMGIPPLLVGLTVVAFGTSAPELAVSIKTGLSGQSEIAVGNVLGSNIFNVLFILGISALVTPLFVTSRLVRIDVPVMIIISALAWFLARNGVIGHIEGAFMLALFVAYTGAIVAFSRKDASNAVAQEMRSAMPLFGVKAFAASLAGILLGLGLLVLGARWLVSGASEMARQFGVSELTIGLTLVAAGTSLPEAATSLVACLRRERDIAVGNIVGSNIFNILCVLAVGGLFAPGGLAVSERSLEFDMPIMLAVALVCLPVFVTGGSVSRREGAFFLFY
ncbi:MAG TPA: calcium/sodium antiporter, partial [Candidatus Hydrogenedentes bacterium]|nr:calcium/sodium antiporter [Candidatus Hydrogenedentota bacterium]